MDSKNLRPFLIIICVWFATVLMSGIWIEARSVGLTLLVGGLAILDIYCTARALFPFFRNDVSDAEFAKKNQGFLLFQAFTWGSIKLVSLTLLGFIFFKVKDLPTSVYGLGLSVFVILPLLGGVLWYFENKSEHEANFPAQYDDSEWGEFKNRKTDEEENPDQ